MGPSVGIFLIGPITADIQQYISEFEAYVGFSSCFPLLHHGWPTPWQ
jgi:hypothetical protein